MSNLRDIVIRALGNTARAGVAAMVKAEPTATRKRRAKKRGDCSPCAAMAAVDAARDRVRNGTL